MVHTMNISFGKMASAGIQGQIPIWPFQPSAFCKRATFTLFTEPKAFQLSDDMDGKVIVYFRDVYIFRRNISHPIKCLGDAPRLVVLKISNFIQ